MSRTVMFLGLLVLVAVVVTAGFAVNAAKPVIAQSAVSKPVAVVAAAPASFRFAKPIADRPEEEPSAPILFHQCVAAHTGAEARWRHAHGAAAAHPPRGGSKAAFARGAEMRWAWLMVPPSDTRAGALTGAGRPVA